MRKLILLIGIMISVLLLTGCFEQQSASVDNDFKDVKLVSNVVTLIQGDIVKNLDDGRIYSVDVNYRFKNPTNRYVYVNVTAEWYDAEDNLLYSGGFKQIGLREGWEEVLVNSFTYNDHDASKVDHVKLIALEAKF